MYWSKHPASTIFILANFPCWNNLISIYRIEKTIAAKDLAEGQTTVDLLRSMLCEVSSYFISTVM